MNMNRMQNVTRIFDHRNRSTKSGKFELHSTVLVLCLALVCNGLWTSRARAHTDALVPAAMPLATCAEPAPAPAAAWPQRYLNFETPQCNPIALSRRGRIYVVNRPGP